MIQFFFSLHCLQKIKSFESIVNLKCESEPLLKLPETKEDISGIFDDYLPSTQPSVKLPPVSKLVIHHIYNQMYVVETNESSFE